MKQKLKKTLNEYQHELTMLKAEHLELLIWYETICELNGKSQEENAELKQQLSEIKGKNIMQDKIGCTIHKNIKWNKFNNVYQCHSCGEIFIPKSSIKTLDRGEVEDLVRMFAQEDITFAFQNLGMDGHELTKKNVERINKYVNAICKLAIPADEDSDVPMPPLDSFPVTVKVTKIVKGEPSICEEE